MTASEIGSEATISRVITTSGSSVKTAFGGLLDGISPHAGNLRKFSLECGLHERTRLDGYRACGNMVGFTAVFQCRQNARAVRFCRIANRADHDAAPVGVIAEKDIPLEFPRVRERRFARVGCLPLAIGHRPLGRLPHESTESGKNLARSRIDFIADSLAVEEHFLHRLQIRFENQFHGVFPRSNCEASVATSGRNSRIGRS